MAWRIEFDRAAERELGKLDPQIAKRILLFLHERVANLEDPRSIGEALKGSRLGDFWKYRVGDYRLINSAIQEGWKLLAVAPGANGVTYVLGRSETPPSGHFFDGDWIGSEKS